MGSFISTADTEKVTIEPVETCHPAVSNRAKHFLKPYFKYMIDQVEAFSVLYDAKTNPNGKIPLAIAENKLMHDIILPKIQAFRSSLPEILNYTVSSGAPMFKNTLVEVLRDRVFKVPTATINADQIVVASGCTALLYALSFIMFDDQDSILIPTPYYPAFDFDFVNLGNVSIIEVNSMNGQVSSGLSIESLDEAYTRSMAQGKRPKTLLLTNPHNPLGTIYSSETLLTAVNWCRSKGMHIICDEIYALSVFGEGADSTFTSIVKVLDNKLGDDVHVLWGLSKDFGASGFRVGVLYSQNKELVHAMGRLSDPMQASHYVQELATHLLSDGSFLDYYFKENRVRLKRSHDIVSESLAKVGIPLIPAISAIFVFADFRSCLRVPTWAAEEELRIAILTECGLTFSPGSSCHSPQPGYFRICYAWVPVDTLMVALGRLSKFVQDIREKQRDSK